LPRRAFSCLQARLVSVQSPRNNCAVKAALLFGKSVG
jgi:hypothetical protein